MAEKIISSAFTIFTISVIIYGYAARNLHNKRNAQNIVCQPELLLWIGTIGSVITGLMCLYFSFMEPTLWAVLLSCAIGCLGIILILYYANCRIEYDEDGFTHKNFFGIKRRFTYNQITAVKGIHSADATMVISYSYRHTRTRLVPVSGKQSEICPVVIYAGKECVRIDEAALGKEAFLKHLKKKYRQLHNGNSIPVIPKKKKDKRQIDIFKGNIKHSNQFVAAFIIMIVFSTVLGTVLYFVGKSDPETFPAFNSKEALPIVYLPFLFTSALALIWIIVGRNAHRIDRRIVKLLFREEYLNF